MVTEDAVTHTILKLRRALRDSARHPHVIDTIPKAGCRLIAQVIGLPDSDQAQTETRASVFAASSVGRGHLAVWAVGICGLVVALIWGLLDSQRSAPAKGDPTVTGSALVILPFLNLGASPEQDYFANGITADLITDLSKVAGVSVTTPGSQDPGRLAKSGVARIGGRSSCFLPGSADDLHWCRNSHRVSSHRSPC